MAAVRSALQPYLSWLSFTTSIFMFKLCITVQVPVICRAFSPLWPLNMLFLRLKTTLAPNKLPLCSVKICCLYFPTWIQWLSMTWRLGQAQPPSKCPKHSPSSHHSDCTVVPSLIVCVSIKLQALGGQEPGLFFSSLCPQRPAQRLTHSRCSIF